MQSISAWPNGRDEVRAGRLSSERAQELARLLAGWKDLADKYPIPPDAPQCRIVYEGKMVEGSDRGAPETFLRVRLLMTEAADAAPLVAGKPLGAP